MMWLLAASEVANTRLKWQTQHIADFSDGNWS